MSLFKNVPSAVYPLFAVVGGVVIGATGFTVYSAMKPDILWTSAQRKSPEYLSLEHHQRVRLLRDSTQKQHTKLWFRK